MSTAAATIRIGPLSDFLSHTRFLLTLRHNLDQSLYKSLILFRLSDESNGTGQIYCMESACPHLGADLSHADIEEITDDHDQSSLVAVCPWHRYDFDLVTGHSQTGMRACTYTCDLRSGANVKDNGELKDIWIGSPEPVNGGWQLVEKRPVSEDFTVSSQKSIALPAADNTQSSAIAAEPQVEPVVPENNPPRTLIDWAVLILNTSSPKLKVERTRHAVHLFRTGKIKSIGHNSPNIQRPPDIPPRADSVRTVDPAKSGKRGKGGSQKSRIAMLHALANIEQWAIDLAWDIIARFGPQHPELPMAFYSDFSKVALDESKHFSLLSQRLEELGSHYGALTVHAGLWDSARETHHSLLARLAIIHLVHEARGLDVNPVTIARFKNAGDLESTRVLNIIHHDEVTHVTAGHRWFTWLCARQELEPVSAFRSAVQTHFWGALKGPFNVEDRARAGLSPAFYENLQGQTAVLAAVQQASAAPRSESPLITDGATELPTIRRPGEAGSASVPPPGGLSFEADKERINQMVPEEGRPATEIGYSLP
ncbi:DUF455-domain-containing protein [Auriculariales sp. MPI-PUGE-AT-0066]|nr:DUF455-domain-containing protein [Auriculariales sp. MPI-PUGE-AT-0066]